MANDQTNDRHWTPPKEGDDGQLSVESVDVNLQESDPTKAVRRNAAELRAKSEDGEDDANDPLSRSRSVKKRMSRLRRSLTTQFDQQRAEDQAKNQREMQDLRDQVRALSASKVGAVSDAEHDVAVAKIRGEIEAAHESGDSKKVADLTAKLIKLEADHTQAQTIALLGGTGRQERVPVQARRGREQDDADADPAKDGIPQAAKRWLKANEDWYRDPEFAPEKAYADAMFVQAKKNGDEESDELFARLTRRLQKQFPNLEVDDSIYADLPRGRKAKTVDVDDEDEDEDELAPRRREAQRPAARSPVRNADDDRGEDFSRRGQTRLNQSDLANMRAFGMDTEDPKALRAYALEKQAGAR